MISRVLSFWAKFLLIRVGPLERCLGVIFWAKLSADSRSICFWRGSKWLWTLRLLRSLLQDLLPFSARLPNVQNRVEIQYPRVLRVIVKPTKHIFVASGSIRILHWQLGRYQSSFLFYREWPFQNSYWSWSNFSCRTVPNGPRDPGECCDSDFFVVITERVICHLRTARIDSGNSTSHRNEAKSDSRRWENAMIDGNLLVWKKSVAHSYEELDWPAVR